MVFLLGTMALKSANLSRFFQSLNTCFQVIKPTWNFKKYLMKSICKIF